MKLPVTNTELIATLQKRVAAWIAGLSGDLAGIEKDIAVSKVTECSEARITYTVECETRILTAFSRPNKDGITTTETAPFERDQVSVWDAKGEAVNEYINYKQAIAIPESIRAVPCRSCGGSGAISCPACAGQKAVYCPQCHGAGREICTVCRGAKNVPCDECGMSGQVFDNLTGKRDKCPKCKGKKEAPCPTCSGTGGQPCPVCNGRQRTACEACGATGNAPCITCDKTGKLVAGFEIEATYKPYTETLELKNSDVPSVVAGKLGSVVSWSKGPLTEEIRATLPKEVVEVAERLKSKVVLPLNSKALMEQLSLEKKPYYHVTFTVAGVPQSVWIAGPKLSVHSDINPVLAMYSGMLEELRGAISGNRLAEASALLKKLGSVPSLAGEVAKLRGKLRFKLFWPGVLGAVLGALIVSLAGVKFLMQALAGSLNVQAVVHQALMANIAAAFFVGLVFFIVGRQQSRGWLKRTIAPAAVTVIVLSLSYGMAALMRYNPARAMDAQQMQAEYAAYFPFGRRTLASDEDIKFLGQLINKYKMAGIDLTQQQKDMIWLEDKIIQDKATLAATEKMRQRIEDIDNGKTHLKQTRSYATHHRYKKRSSTLRIK